MKKVLAVLFSLIMICSCTMAVSAAVRAETFATKTDFYIQRYGAQMDEEGQVTSREAAFFTPVVYSGRLNDGTRSTDYTVVYKEGVVSSDDVISEVVNKPEDADILAKIKSIYGDDGYILSSNGKVVNWSKFTTDNYEIRWYVLKCELGAWSFLDVWHVDGVIVEKVTDKPIEVVTPDDPGYIPPEEREADTEDYEPGKTIEYKSNFAYIYGYNDEIMGAENNLLRSEVSAMVYRLVRQNGGLGDFAYNEADIPAFDDIEGEWFRSGIEFMNSKGAYADGESVHPYVAVTRGESFKIICLGFGFSEDSKLSYDEYADILYKAGYIQGDENGDLNIWKLITRAEFCTIYNRIIGRDAAGLTTADGVAVTAETYGFTDLDSSKWYYETMVKATSAYDDDGYVDINLRNLREILDDYQ